jgi:hypothetical protein
MCVTYRRVLDWTIRFIDTFSIQFITTINYSATAIYTVHCYAHKCLQSITPYSSRFLPTCSYQCHCNCSTHEVVFAQSNSFLVISSQSPSIAELSQFSAAAANSGTRLNSNSSCVRSSFYSLGADPQKTPLPLLLRVDSLLQRCVYRTVAEKRARRGPTENAALNTHSIAA